MAMLVTLAAMKDFLGIANTTTFTPVLANLTVATGTSRITRAAGSWVTDGVTVGTQMTFAGFSNAGNNISVTVASVISATIIELSSVVGMVDEVATGVTFQKASIAGNSTYDAFLTEQITLVSDAVEGYCGRVFEETDYVQTFYYDELEEFDEKFPKELYLYHYPVSAVTAVTLGTPPTEDFTQYRVIGKSGKIRNLNCGWFTNGADLEIEYTAGYDIIPSVLQHVVYNLVQERYNKKVAGVDLNFGNNVQRISIPGTISLDFDYTLSSNERKNAYGMLLGDYMNVLDPWRSERVLIGEVRNKYVE